MMQCQDDCHQYQFVHHAMYKNRCLLHRLILGPAHHNVGGERECGVQRTGEAIGDRLKQGYIRWSYVLWNLKSQCKQEGKWSIYMNHLSQS